MLRHIEKVRLSILEKINKLRNNPRIEPNINLSSFKEKVIEPLDVKGFPVYQFSYDGMLPHSDESDISYIRKIRNYYYQLTLDAYDFDNLEKRLDKAIIIFVQYFNTNLIKDLDNRNKKYIQDAIKRTGLIEDDSWDRVWNMDIGFKDEISNHVQVYVVEPSYFSLFFDYLLENHEKMKLNRDNIISQKDFFKLYKERDKESEINEDIINLFKEIN